MNYWVNWLFYVQENIIGNNMYSSLLARCGLRNEASDVKSDFLM